MKKIILYSAISLDGKIAKEDGGVEWLDDIPNPDEMDYGYFDFYDTIDTTLMGNKTYQQVLGFDVPFPYPEKDNYVLTKDKKLEADENVSYISNDPIQFIKALKAGTGKDIWLIGGAAINTLLLNNHLIDRMIVHVMPALVGPGIPLFSGKPDFTKLKLIESQNYNTGVVELIYDFDY